MKFIPVLLLCLCCWLLLGDRQVAAQSPTPHPRIIDPTQFDSFSGDILPSDEKARLDNLATALEREPEQVAHIFVYAGKRPCPGETQAKIAFIKNHFVKTRGIKSDRVILQDGGYRDELTVELWLWPRTSEFSPPSAAPHFDPDEVRVRRNCKPTSRRRRR